MKIWIYKDGQQSGPYTPDQLAELGVSPRTRVWYSGLPRWCEAGSLPELAFLFGQKPEAAQATPLFIAQPPSQPQQLSAADSAEQKAPQCPPSHLVWAVLLTLLCCSPFAIAAIVTGVLASARHAEGNFSASRRLGEATEWLIMLAFALGALPSMLLLAFI